jgi:hypothetical protein
MAEGGRDDQNWGDCAQMDWKMSLLEIFVNYSGLFRDNRIDLRIGLEKEVHCEHF